ncbi:MAG: endoglucanase, partial [Pseudonocardiales bacterium]|nr:endoglucanase [Pseudonocardiales bacterium]
MIAMVVLLGISACAPAAGADTRLALVRVDQVGYAADETKHAYVVSQRSASGAWYRVVDESGQTVLGGTTGASTGSWNTKYRAVSVLDLSELKTPGRYRVEVSGAVTGKSPEFRVGARQELFGGLAAGNVRFFRAQRDGASVDGSLLRRKPSHLADRTA